MAKQKVTITLDRSKADDARHLLGAASTSDVIDRALDCLIRTERLRSDVAAYLRLPPAGAEDRLAELADLAALGDDTDWEALYSADGVG